MPDTAEPLALRFDDYLLDRSAGVLLRVHPYGQMSRVPLGARAFGILCLLAERRGAIVTRQEIMDAVWPDVVVEENNLSVQLSNLRRALDADQGPGSCIQTLPGRGYRLLSPVTQWDRRAAEQGVRNRGLDVTESLGASEQSLHTTAAEPVAPVESMANDQPLANRQPASWHRRSAWIAAGFAALVLILVGTWLATFPPTRPHPADAAASLPAPTAVQTLSANPERPRLSLAVLPFDRLGDDVEPKAVEVVVEDLTTELSRMPPGFRVIARNQAAAYKGRPIDVKRAGEELNVRYAVEGSLRKDDGMLRISAQLVSAETGEHIWADRFTVGTDVGADSLEDAVWRIAFRMQHRLLETESARSLRERPGNPDATDALLRAYALYFMPPSPQKKTRLVALFEQAVELDPASALALAGLAEALLDSLPFLIGDDPTAPAKLRRAEELVSRAELIDPNHKMVMWTRTFLLGKQERCAELVPAAHRAIEAHPRLTGTTQWLGICLLREGKAAEAIPWFEQSIRAMPFNPQIHIRYRLMGLACLVLERYGEASSWFRKALAADPSLGAYEQGFLYAAIAAAQALSGEVEAARLTGIEARRIWPTLTARGFGPLYIKNQVAAAQFDRVRDGLRAAGVRDHADEDADTGLTAEDVLHSTYEWPTPAGVPGARTIRTPELAVLVQERQPVVLDAMPWGASIPGAIGLWGAGVAGSLSDEYQDRLRRKMQALTGGDRSVPVATVGWNAERYQGRNLALRLVALGYTEVYWYRGGREAWMAAGLPLAEVTLQDW
jgi:TolB-like protein/DNA-binding winged helix-turn-helix (wHTH) protein/tetratricopeptide (TPR) repeat protein